MCLADVIGKQIAMRNPSSAFIASSTPLFKNQDLCIFLFLILEQQWLSSYLFFNWFLSLNE